MTEPIIASESITPLSIGSLPALPTQSATYYAQGQWRHGTFVDDLHALARTAADQPAYINVRTLLGGSVTVTFGELARHVEQFAAVLRTRGVRPGDVVAWQLPNWWESGALWLACVRVGAVALSLPPGTGAREREIMMTGTRARLFIASDHDATDGCADASVLRLGELLLDADLAVPLSVAERPAVHADSVCQVLCTSGTTGRAKAVLHTHNTRYAALRAALPHLPQNAVTAAASTLTHAIGLIFNLLSPLATGRPSVFTDTHDTAVWLDLLARHRVNCLLAAPRTLGELVDAQRAKPRDLGELRQVTSVAAPLPEPVAARVRRFLCPRLVRFYGMTEAGTVMATSPQDASASAGRGLGRPVRGTRLRLTETDDPGAGLLHVRGPGLCRAMFDLRTSRELWSPAHDEGWYDTGDLVATDAEGGLRYLSRAADRIGWGYVIPVAEVESELLDHPGIAEAVIVGVPDAQGHEVACAVVVPRGTPLTLDGIRSFLRARSMTEFYLPVRLALVPELPRTALGKVRKEQVRRQIGSDTGGGRPCTTPPESRR
ncbi:AMP-binding protein [Streptomyces sp. NBC_00083]|uniref:AMP-binding protein n=1 Tax=Streptomyces sp. NBC_00083 TaxID=2975647 RepID=UPI00224F2F56|nr:AMP-binding protein [Streptomyces sp. NBC_00083]MCX5387440.1 AMP-binding protein [Streptomyces sp. NBC_00083]